MATDGDPSDVSVKRVHETNNALHIVQGALYTLIGYGNELTADARSQLTLAVAEGLSRLARLLSAPSPDVPASSLAAIIEGASRAAIARGTDVRLSIEDAVRVSVHREDLGRVLEELFVAAAPDGSTNVGLRHEGDGAAIEIAPANAGGIASPLWLVLGSVS